MVASGKPFIFANNLETVIPEPKAKIMLCIHNTRVHIRKRDTYACVLFRVIVSSVCPACCFVTLYKLGFGDILDSKTYIHSLHENIQRWCQCRWILNT